MILNKVRRERDGEWRTIDGKAIYRERGAAAAQGALVMETALTNALGVQWVRRDDGHGREIKGVTQALMDEFSKRTRQEIAAQARRAGRRVQGCATGTTRTRARSARCA